MLFLVPSKLFVLTKTKNTFFIEDTEGSVEGTFLLSALERLKVGVGSSSLDLLECSAPAGICCERNLSRVRANAPVQGIGIGLS